ncbi:MAG: hypothetical protein LW870_21345, partial [Pirellula sp.]|nr:hypothetical protein [Pirellula sp.]
AVKAPIALLDLSHASFISALASWQQERAKITSLAPIFVLPDGDDNGYLNYCTLVSVRYAASASSSSNKSQSG